LKWTNEEERYQFGTLNQILQKDKAVHERKKSKDGRQKGVWGAKGGDPVKLVSFFFLGPFPLSFGHAYITSFSYPFPTLLF